VLEITLRAQSWRFLWPTLIKAILIKLINISSCGDKDLIDLHWQRVEKALEMRASLQKGLVANALHFSKIAFKLQ
jgi:hypothetical protein